jgi:hypothetical protein
MNTRAEGSAKGILRARLKGFAGAEAPSPVKRCVGRSSMASARGRRYTSAEEGARGFSPVA